MSTLLGNLFILAAPSGAGKSSLIKALLAKTPPTGANPLQVSVSHTTRKPRPGEVNGEHYHFVSHAEFEALIAQNAFFEYAEVFGNYYGTSRITIEETLHQGIDVFLDIDWQGARQVETLRQRLEGRGQDDESVIAKRMAEAVSEMSHYNEFDYVLINDDFDTTLAELNNIVQAQRLRTHKQQLRHDALVKALLA